MNLLVLKQANVVVVATKLIIHLLCVSDVVKNLNVKVFNLMSRTNEKRHMEWRETCKCNVDQMQPFIIINNVGMMINAGVNAKN